MKNFRLIQQTYEQDIVQEEPGSITDSVEHDRGCVAIWFDVLDNEPDDQYFHDFGLSLPGDSVEEETGEPSDGGLCVGDLSYSYRLEERVGGKWQYCKAVSGIRRSES